jgi:beta-mannosidase
MANQVKELFGSIPENLNDFILASQITQAEALKFFVERARLSNKIWGIIWWNVIDCWPQISDAIVDYYFNKKLAYYYIKRVQEPFCIMVSEPEAWHIKVVGVNDTFLEKTGSYRVFDADTKEELSSGNFSISSYSKATLGKIRVSRGEQKMLVIEWESDGKKFLNHYLLGNPPFNLTKYIEWMKVLQLSY